MATLLVQLTTVNYGDYIIVDCVSYYLPKKVCGDSMVGAHINDGDIVYVRQQPEVESGEIAVVLVDDAATLERFYKVDRAVILRSENPKCKDMIFSTKEAKSIKVLGRAVYLKTEIK